MKRLGVHLCIGGRVLVPRAVYPTYACDENGGEGWTAFFLRCSRTGAAALRFTDATTTRGIPHEDVELQLSALAPILVFAF